MFIGYARPGNPLTMWTSSSPSSSPPRWPASAPPVFRARGAIMRCSWCSKSIGMKVEAGSAIAAAYAMISGIDAPLDMGRTCLNVGGDMAGARWSPSRKAKLRTGNNESGRFLSAIRHEGTGRFRQAQATYGDRPNQ